MNKKILWASRHPMSEEQLVDLNKKFNLDVKKEDIESRNIIWAATGDVDADITANQAVLGTLGSEFEIIAGVFPPVVFEAIHATGLKVGRPTILVSPVSRQAPELRKGEGQIPFVHVRWTDVLAVF